MQGIPATSLVAISSQWDANRQQLYVPLLDVESKLVGYKTLSISIDGTLVEKTIPETNCAGLISLKCSSVTTKASSKEQSNAILVLNVLDLLALSTVKLNGEFKIFTIFLAV